MQLLDYFKELTVHPKNAKELKGLILQLAIQGKLTNNSDNWHFGTLSELGEWAIGSGFPKAEQGNSKGEIPFIKVSDMNLDGNEKLIQTSNNYISKEVAQKIRAKIHPKGTVVFPKIGGAIATNKRRVLVGPTSFDNNCLGLIPNEKTTSEWIFLVLSSIDMMKFQSGTSVPALSQKVLEKIPSSIPPLEEQKAIVAIVNQLFQEVEQLEALTNERVQLKADFVTSALQQLTQAEAKDTASQWAFLQEHFGTFLTEKANVKKLRESILQLAVQGKLTQDWRKQRTLSGVEVEDASVLLERIQAEKAQLIAEKKIKKTRENGDIVEGEFDVTLPDSWTIAKTVDLGFITKLAGFEYSKYINLQDEGEVPVIRAQNVKPNRIDERKLKYIDLKTSKLLSRCELVKESVLITFIGAGIGEVAVFRKKERWHLAPNVAKLEPFNEFNYNIEIDYLLFYLLSPIGRKELFKHLKSTAQPSLSMGTIRDIIVCLPPMEEQQAIVAKVNALMALCDSLEKEIETHQTTQEHWMQSCLKEVFEEPVNTTEVTSKETLSMAAEGSAEYKK